jgi:hypothetical protein
MEVTMAAKKVTKKSAAKKKAAPKNKTKMVAKKRAPAKPAKKKSAPKNKAKTAAKKKAPPKPAKKKPAPKHAPVPPLKTFAEKVRERDAGTEVWFTVAGGIEHAAIQRRGSDGAVVIRTDAGITEVVPSGNLFETADQARAARTR